eukprot:6196063-Pleurochrysis_carterae.AAC.1
MRSRTSTRAGLTAYAYAHSQARSHTASSYRLAHACAQSRVSLSCAVLYRRSLDGSLRLHVLLETKRAIETQKLLSYISVTHTPPHLLPSLQAVTTLRTQLDGRERKNGSLTRARARERTHLLLPEYGYLWVLTHVPLPSAHFFASTHPSPLFLCRRDCYLPTRVPSCSARAALRSSTSQSTTRPRSPSR